MGKQDNTKYGHKSYTVTAECYDWGENVVTLTRKINAKCDESSAIRQVYLKLKSEGYKWIEILNVECK